MAAVTNMERRFPNAAALFSLQLKPLEQIKDSCLVALDANTLLRPYTANAESLAEIERIYAKLAREKRLIVPAQAAREFAANRAGKLGELLQQIQVYRSSIVIKPLPRYAVLEAIPGYKELREAETKLRAAETDFGAATHAIAQRIRALRWDDPVSLMYAQLLTPNAVVEAQLNQEELDRDAAYRKEQSLPPGYKDKSSGDVVIWHTLLELGRQRHQDLIFVSGDEKTDWWHQSGGAKLYPRFELVEEFSRESGGASFYILSLAEVLEFFGAPEGVVKDLNSSEQPRDAQETPDINEIYPSTPIVLPSIIEFEPSPSGFVPRLRVLVRGIDDVFPPFWVSGIGDIREISDRWVGRIRHPLTMVGPAYEKAGALSLTNAAIRLVGIPGETHVKIELPQRMYKEELVETLRSKLPLLNWERVHPEPDR